MKIGKICQYSSPSGCAKLENESCLKDVLKLFKDLLKDTTTNGQVIKALFPKAYYEEPYDDEYVRIHFYDRSPMVVIKADLDWWNSKYVKDKGDTNG